MSVFRDENQVAEVKTASQKPRVEDPGRVARPPASRSPEPGGRTEDECAVTWLPRPGLVGRPGSAGSVPNAARSGPLRGLPGRGAPRGPPLPHRGLSPRRRPGPPRLPARTIPGSPARPRAEARATLPPPRRGPSQRASSRRPRETAPRERAREEDVSQGVRRPRCRHPYLTPGDKLVGVSFLYKRPQLAEESRHVRTLLHC